MCGPKARCDASAYRTAVRLFTLILTLGACRPSYQPGNVTRDSLGTTIVENTTAEWGANGWRFAEEPSLTIGDRQGDPSHELHEPRSAHRLRDGRIVIGDQGLLQLRYYDSAGNHLLDAGRAGGGPGEFERISSVFPLENDSMAVFDATQHRITVFDPHGAFVRAVTLPVYDRSFDPLIAARRTDGSYVGLINSRQSIDDLPDGLFTDSVTLVLLDGNGAPLDTLGTFANQVRDVAMRSLAGRRFRGATPIVFSPRATWAVRGDHVYVGNSASYEIQVVDSVGRPVRIMRLAQEPGAVSEQDRADYLAQMREIYADRLADERMAIEVNYLFAAIEASPLPERFPAYDPDIRDDRGRRIGHPLIPDELGNLWVLENRRPREQQLRWSVFGPEGRYLGTITGPQRFFMTEVGADYVLGWSTDVLGVGRVQLFSLIK